MFVSNFEIGDPVNFNMRGQSTPGYIRTITLTAGKVRYSIKVFSQDEIPSGADGIGTTLHNVDSVLVSPRDGDPIEFDFDNYS